MTTIFLYKVQDITVGILEVLEKLTNQNMVEELMNFIKFWNTMVKTVLYQMEMNAFSNVLFMSS